MLCSNQNHQEHVSLAGVGCSEVTILRTVLAPCDAEGNGEGSTKIWGSLLGGVTDSPSACSSVSPVSLMRDRGLMLQI